MEKIEVKSVNINVTTLTLKVGETVTVKATVLPVDATDKSVTWTSSDPAVATVEDGVITALKLGTASITAKAGEKTANCKVTVEPTPVATVTLDKDNVTLKVGESATLKATVGPEDATDKTLTWTSSDPAVVTVEDGVITALKLGTASITAKAGEKTASCKVTVEPTPVANVALDKDNVTLKVGEKATLQATVGPEDATDKTLTWTSSDPTVATVEDGVITALKLGTASITAKAGDKTASCQVTVEPTPVASVTLDRDNVTLKVGEKATLQATVGPEDATDKTLTWTSSDPTVATVEDGVITALKLGTASITAKAGDKTASCQVTVEPTPVSSVTLDQTSARLKKGETIKLNAIVLPNDATYKTVTWTSSDPKVATVNDGVVTALLVGTTTISAVADGVMATCQIEVIGVGDYGEDKDVFTLQRGLEGLDIVLMGDGFTQDDIQRGYYAQVMNQVMDAFFKIEPYATLRDDFNVVYINAASPENFDAVNTGSNGATNGKAVTKFSVQFTPNSTSLSGDDDLAYDYAEIALGNNGPRADKATIIVVVNQKCRAGTSVMHYSLYGSTDYNPYYSVNYCALGRYSQEMDEIMQHEICGHGFASLGDEYFYSSSTINVNYSLFERMQSKGMYRNIDKYIDENLQNQGIDYPLTTKENVYWKDLFNTVNDYESTEALGVFKGAYTYSFGYCRPTEDGAVSVMGSGYMFNAPSRRSIYYKYLRASGKVQSNIFGTEEELAAFLRWDSEIQKKIKSSSSYVRGNLNGANTTMFAPPVLKSGHLVNGRFVTDPVPSRPGGVRVSGR
ncbi:MAG: Ig-like domain-containing protein [Candidatus Cryptobacteroides sp.]